MLSRSKSQPAFSISLPILFLNGTFAALAEPPSKSSALQCTGTQMVSNSGKLSVIRDHYLYGVIDKEIFPKVTGTDQTNNPGAIISDFFLRKATKTLDAMCMLCEAGFAEDALVLGRTIFELSVHLQTIASPESVEQRRLKAECFIYDGDRQRVGKLKEMAELKQQGKCLSWISEIEANNPVSETIPIPKDFVRPKRLKDMATDLVLLSHEI